MATVTIPAARGMLMAIACIPGRVGLPTLDGAWWRIEYETARQAVLAWCRRYAGWRRQIMTGSTRTYDARDLVRNAETRWSQYCGEPVARRAAVVTVYALDAVATMPDPVARPLPYVAVRGTVTRWTPRVVRGKRWTVEEAA